MVRPHSARIAIWLRMNTGKSIANDQDAAGSEKEEQVDHILALLERYPTNSTEDYTTPLTEEELQGTWPLHSSLIRIITHVLQILASKSCTSSTRPAPHSRLCAT